MKREFIVLLAVFFFLAISGLVIIQVRWINSVVSTEDQEFRFGVNEALKEVVSELEKEETYNRIISEINPEPQEGLAADDSNSDEELSPDTRLLEKYGFSPGVRSVIVNRAGRTYLLPSDSVQPEPFIDDSEPAQQMLTAGATGRMTNKVIAIEDIVSRILRSDTSSQRPLYFRRTQ